jgi:uncharacterized protein
MRNAATDRKTYEMALKRAMRPNANYTEIAPLLTAAHESGDPRATYALATWYLHGRAFRRNVRKAVALLRVAASNGIPDALYDLAVCNENGEGTPKNESRAVELYLRAALLGEKQSIYEVGRCYYYGIGVKVDRAIARVWLDRAKDLGVKGVSSVEQK